MMACLIISLFVVVLLQLLLATGQKDTKSFEISALILCFVLSIGLSTLWFFTDKQYQRINFVMNLLRNNRLVVRDQRPLHTSRTISNRTRNINARFGMNVEEPKTHFKVFPMEQRCNEMIENLSNYDNVEQEPTPDHSIYENVEQLTPHQFASIPTLFDSTRCELNGHEQTLPLFKEQDFELNVNKLNDETESDDDEEQPLLSKSHSKKRVIANAMPSKPPQGNLLNSIAAKQTVVDASKKCLNQLLENNERFKYKSESAEQLNISSCCSNQSFFDNEDESALLRKEESNNTLPSISQLKSNGSSTRLPSIDSFLEPRTNTRSLETKGQAVRPYLFINPHIYVPFPVQYCDLVDPRKDLLPQLKPKKRCRATSLPVNDCRETIAMTTFTKAKSENDAVNKIISSTETL